MHDAMQRARHACMRHMCRWLKFDRAHLCFLKSVCLVGRRELGAWLVAFEFIQIATMSVS